MLQLDDVAEVAVRVAGGGARRARPVPPRSGSAREGSAPRGTGRCRGTPRPPRAPAARRCRPRRCRPSRSARGSGRAARYAGTASFTEANMRAKARTVSIGSPCVQWMRAMSACATGTNSLSGWSRTIRSKRRERAGQVAAPACAARPSRRPGACSPMKVAWWCEQVVEARRARRSRRRSAGGFASRFHCAGAGLRAGRDRGRPPRRSRPRPPPSAPPRRRCVRLGEALGHGRRRCAGASGAGRAARRRARPERSGSDASRRSGRRRRERPDGDDDREQDARRRERERLEDTALSELPRVAVRIGRDPIPTAFLRAIEPRVAIAIDAEPHPGPRRHAGVGEDVGSRDGAAQRRLRCGRLARGCPARSCRSSCRRRSPCAAPAISPFTIRSQLPASACATSVAMVEMTRGVRLVGRRDRHLPADRRRRLGREGEHEREEVALLRACVLVKTRRGEELGQADGAVVDEAEAALLRGECRCSRRCRSAGSGGSRRSRPSRTCSGAAGS